MIERAATSWARHWARGDRGLAERFNTLTPQDVIPLFEAIGPPLRAAPESLGSVENRVFSCDVGAGDSVILKLYRPGRWSLDALREEMDFLRDARAEGVAVVTPRPLPGGDEIGMFRGMAFVLLERERVIARPPGPFSEEEILELGRLTARLHVAARRRPALHRMRIEARSMGLQNLRFVERGGLLPPDLLPEYGRLVREITARSGPLLRGVPLQRLHGDLGAHNLLWTERGVVIADFDDFMVGPAAFDLCRLHVGITTPWGDPASSDGARDRVLALALRGYREVLPLPDEHARAMGALRALRMAYNDAWKRARLHDAAFRSARRAIYDRAFWLPRLASLRAELALLRAAAPSVTPRSRSPAAPR